MPSLDDVRKIPFEKKNNENVLITNANTLLTFQNKWKNIRKISDCFATLTY